jgi:hypothetical protein
MLDLKLSSLGQFFFGGVKKLQDMDDGIYFSFAEHLNALVLIVTVSGIVEEGMSKVIPLCLQLLRYLYVYLQQNHTIQ